MLFCLADKILEQRKAGLAFKDPLADRKNLRSPISGFSNFESDITNSSLIIKDNTFSNIGNITGSAAVALNNVYNSTYNGDYLIENNNFSSSYYGILISVPGSDEIRAELESKNNFDRGTVYKNIIFYKPPTR